MIGFKTQSRTQSEALKSGELRSRIEIFHPTLSQGLLWIVFSPPVGFTRWMSAAALRYNSSTWHHQHLRVGA